MKIVVLDGYTLNPGDLSWDPLNRLGEVTRHDRTPADLVAERCAEAEIILTNKTPVTAGIMAQLPQLKYIGVLATGFNVVDTAAARSRGIVVTNVPGYSTASVAQLTFALLLELCHHVQRHSDSVAAGKWAASDDFSYHDHPLIELSGRTMGIIGFGTIGRNVAQIASAFGMRVIGNSRTMTGTPDLPYFEWAPVPELLERSDVVSIHCPLSAETTGLINHDTLRKMKNSAFLLNTSRGPVVNDQHLAEALNNNVIAGAGLDVLSAEPPAKDNPLFTAKNCLITPHIAWATKEARARLLEHVAANISAFLSGKPVNVVT